MKLRTSAIVLLASFWVVWYVVITATFRGLSALPHALVSP